MQETIATILAVDTRTAAKMLGVSKSHLEHLRMDDPDNSPPTIRVGRCVRYPVNGLVAWAEEQAR